MKVCTYNAYLLPTYCIVYLGKQQLWPPASTVAIETVKYSLRKYITCMKYINANLSLN